MFSGLTVRSSIAINTPWKKFLVLSGLLKDSSANAANLASRVKEFA
jgi:hypothetical protein